MERNEISAHEVRLFTTLEACKGGWITSKDAAVRASVADRTARALLLKLVRLGVVDQAEVFPAHRYRLAEKAAKRNLGYLNRLIEARKVFESVVT